MASEIKIGWHKVSKRWRKSITVDGKEKDHYYQYPKTTKGKELAIADYLRDKAALTGESFESKIQKYFPLIIDHYVRFPAFEGLLIWHLRKMLSTLELPGEKWQTAMLELRFPQHRYSSPAMEEDIWRQTLTPEAEIECFGDSANNQLQVVG